NRRSHATGPRACSTASMRSNEAAPRGIGAAGVNPSVLRRARLLLKHAAEAVAVVLLATMFVAFLIQIVFRYVLNWPIGWTSEVSTAMWLWAVLWGAAFVVDEREEIRFDLLYAAVGATVRRVFDLLTSAALIVVYAVSLPAIVGYVSFMRVERTDYLK